MTRQRVLHLSFQILEPALLHAPTQWCILEYSQQGERRGLPNWHLKINQSITCSVTQHKWFQNQKPSACSFPRTYPGHQFFFLACGNLMAVETHCHPITALDQYMQHPLVVNQQIKTSRLWMFSYKRDFKIGSAPSRGWHSGPETFWPGHYKDLTKIGSPAWIVSGTQGTYLEQHIEMFRYEIFNWMDCVYGKQHRFRTKLIYNNYIQV